MVLGSPLLHALSGLARARLGWLCPRAWGGELVVRVSNRNVIAHCMRDKVHVTNSWQSSRPMHRATMMHIGHVRLDCQEFVT